MGGRKITYRRKKPRRKKILFAAIALFLVTAMGIGLFMNAGTEPLAAEKTYTADDQTLDDWRDNLSTTTENIGRIWTDKSVAKEDVKLEGDSGIEIEKDADSDFLVSLSALSTASSLTSTTTTPLDIVLVLDRSGSMDDTLYTYTEVYSGELNTNSTYYISVNGNWQSVTYSRFSGWGYGQGLNRTSVTPKTSADDDNADHVQFYSRARGRTKMTALKNAVGNFLDQTATANEGVSADKQHRIGIVSYSSSARTDQSLNYCTSSTVENMKNTVNGLDADGSTGADYAMEEVEGVLGNARTGAKKLVIFFTDGEPNHWNGFDNTVARDTVNAAKSIKDNGATIYTIGVFEDADPSDTNSNFNKYMNAVSSNYPSATASGNNFNVTLGNGSADSGYYKAASDASGLNSVFDDIFDSEVTGSGAPTQVTETEGFDATNSGYITFTDTLGDYVHFDDLNTVVYGNTKFRYDRKSEDGDKTTYIFESRTVESGVYDGNIKDLVVTVTKGQGSSGDVVEVKVPASLIPCRYFDVTTEDGQTEVKITHDAMPIRIFYDVSLDNTVDEQVMNGNISESLQTYIDGHKTDDGKVNFYSNKYESGNVGTTTARFTPGTGNSFYYFTEDTPLYTSDNTNSPATGQFSSSATYYYQITYYDTANNSQKTKWVSTRGLDSQYIGRDNGQLYVRSGTKRISRANDFSDTKDDNKTGTASSYISPAWQTDGDDVIVSLGNNGRIQLELPGTLSVAKNVEADAGFTAPEGEEFTFILNLKDGEGADLTGNYTAKIFDDDDQEQQAQDYTVTNGSSFTLQKGWHMEVYGLPDGASYTVEETAKDHYDTTNDSRDGAADTAEGTIAAGTLSNVTFTNTYGLEPITVDTTNLFTANKVLDGRDWEDTDSFTFRMAAGNDNARRVLTSDKTVTLSEQGHSYKDGDEIAIDYGNITFDQPGEYWFALTEDVPDPGRIPGISYTEARYRVVVTVTDNNGTLEASSVMYVLTEEDGTEVTPEDNPVDDKKAVFTNRFSADSVRSGPTGVKIYTDHSGNKPLELNMFQFEVEALDGAPLPPGTDDDGDNKITVSNATTTDRAEISFGLMEFTSDMVGDVYKYKVTEKIPVEAAPGTDPDTKVLNGMTYDAHTYYFVIEIDHETGGSGSEVVVPKYTYCTDPDDPTGTELKNQDGDAQGTLIFRNEYNVEPLSLTGNTGLHGTKTLDGRDMLANEEYTFTIEGADQTTQNAITNKVVTIADNTAKVSGGTDGTAKDFRFGDVTFTQPGTYKFNIKETIPAQNPGGMTYDRHTAAVTVVVKDRNGTLEAESVTYDNGNVSDDNTQAVFVNTYAASGTLTGAANLSVTKNFTGRPNDAWLSGDTFTFELAGYDETTKQAITDKKITLTNDKVTANSYNKTVSFGDISFTEPGTYQFVVTEEKGSLANVTYDGRKKVVTVKAADNGNGTLNVEVESITDADTHADTTLTFENVYEPDEATLTGEGNLDITKRLIGREDNQWLDTDAFSFQMEAADDVTKQAFDSGEIRFKDGGKTDEITIKADVKPDDRDRRTGSFGDMIFTKAGTYSFTVKETTKTGEIAGVTCDDGTGTITITVQDNGDGTLDPQVSYTGRRNFVNTYEASGTYHLTGEKQITGRDFQTGDSFTFQVTGEEDAPMPDKVDADGKLTIEPTSGKTAALDFGTMTFDHAGTYTYQVTEESKDANGVISDSTEYTVKVTVKDANDGTLTANAEITGGEGDAVVFTNVYAPGAAALDGNANLKVTKELTGGSRGWKEGDSFTFTLEGYADDKATMDAIDAGNIILPNNAGGITITDENDPKEAAFGNIIFKKAGKYVFNIREKKGDIGGITYDEKDHLVKVTVTDKLDGTMTAEATDGANPTITNTYAPGGTTQVTSADFDLKKVLEGKAWNGDKFTFTLEAVSGKEGGTDIAAADIPMPDETKVTVDSPDQKDGKEAVFGFGPIEYKAEGTYVYKVTEEKGSNGGMRYDTHEATITVTVKDDQNGGYAASVSTENGIFTNTYSTALDYNAKGGLNLTKNLTGHDLAAGQFAFTVTAADEASKEKAGFDGMSKAIQTTAASMNSAGVSSAAMAVFGDGTMEFDASDDGKTYQYEISETKKGGSGYTNDSTKYTVTIKVKDNGNGLLTATTTVSGGGEEKTYTYTNESSQAAAANVVFDNRYDASGSLGGNGKVSVKATKKLENGNLDAGEFKFRITNKNHPGGGAAASGTNAKDGTITFGEIKYDIDGMNRDVQNGYAAKEQNSKGNYVYTYSYTVSEDTADLPNGVTAVDSHFDITVNVTDNGDGTLDVKVNYPSGADALTFVNKYSAESAQILINGSKVIKTGSGSHAPTLAEIANKYEFTISAEKGTPMPKNTTVKNDAAGNISFGRISYTDDIFDGVEYNDDGTRERTFTYTVKESGGKVSGITNDTSEKTIKVTVKDDGEGKLSAAAEPAQGTLFTFTNTYHVTPGMSTPTDGSLTIKKELDGRNLKEGEFHFQMTNANGTVVSKGSNTADGSVAFSKIKFEKPGTYAYTISEVKGDLGGVTYDGSTYKAAAQAEDNGDGTMSVSWKVTNADNKEIQKITFKNAYKAAPTNVTLGAAKILKGRPAKAEEFTFALKDENGKVISEASNDKNGSVQFETISYDKTGTYTYTVSEVKGSDQTITYDNTAYKVTVKVTDNGKGTLEASIDNGGKDVVFHNVYTKPVKPQETQKPEKPKQPDIITGIKTGDPAVIAPLVLIMAALAAILTGAIIRRRRR